MRLFNRNRRPATAAEKSRFHIGMRNVKTGLSVFLCLGLYYFIGREGASLACTSAIICMQDSIEKSVDSGRNRLIGTAFGALLGMGLLYLNVFAAPVLDLSLITATVGTMLFILFCNIIHKQDAIVIGCVVLLTIVLQQSDVSPFLYSVDRLIDTFVGIFLAVIVNLLIRNPVNLDTGEDGGQPQDQPEPPCPEAPAQAADIPTSPEEPGDSETQGKQTEQEGMD